MSDLFTGTDVRYEHSEAESRRFGVSVARLSVPLASDLASSLSRVRILLASAEDDVVILRYPSARVTWFAELLGTGRDLLHADSMVYFERELSGAAPTMPQGWPPTDLRTAEGHEVDHEALVRLVPEVFASLHNHYRANPILDSDAALAGYQEWVGSSLRRDRVVCVTDERLDPLGFLTLSTESSRAELLLGGVVASARRRSVFSAVLLAAARVAHEAGCAAVWGPTHTHNIAMQRVFGRAGFRPVAAVNTVHAVRPGLLSSQRG